MSVKMRQEVEKKILRSAAEAVIAAGFSIIVNDGEKDATERLADVDAVMAAVCSTDEDYFVVCKRTKRVANSQFGWIRFIYGNDGWDVINDYTTNLEDILKPTIALAESYA